MLLWFAAIAAAQQPIRVETRLVEVNVIVHDKRGPVTDLKQSDFRLFDNSKEQKIALFRMSQATPAASANKPPLPPGVFTNRYEDRSDPPVTATVLLIDLLNTDMLDQNYAKKQVEELLAKLTVDEPIAIYLLGQRLSVVQDFTTDSQLLRKAAAGLQPQQSVLLSESNTPTPIMPGGSGATAEAIKQGFREARTNANLERGGVTVDAFEQIAQHLKRVPGRKNIVWVSGTFPYAPAKMTALNEADVAINPVDARGLIAIPINPRDPSHVGLPGAPSGLDAIEKIAMNTGGKAFYNTNDIQGAVQSALSDAQVTYTLAFYPQGVKYDGDFHTLRVTVDRSGLDVRSRAGYYDPADKPKVSIDPDIELRHAADSPLDASLIGLIAAVAREGSQFKVAVQIAFQDLMVANAAPDNKDSHWNGAADLAFVSQAADGHMLNLASKALTFDLTADWPQRAAILKSIGRWKTSMKLAIGLGALPRGCGAAGSSDSLWCDRSEEHP